MEDKEVVMFSNDFDDEELILDNEVLVGDIEENDVKYTYIKRDIKGNYVVLNNILTSDLYSNLGETWDDYLENKWVLLTDEQISFKDSNPTAKVKEVFNMELTPIAERTLEDAKREMKNKIYEYDQSINVNGFTINNEIEAWFTVQERTNYKSSIDAAKLLGVETLSFYVGDVMFNISPAMAEQMLAQIQLYADQCFIITKQHKSMVDSLENIDDVDNYEYMNGYPTKLNFELA